MKIGKWTFGKRNKEQEKVTDNVFSFDREKHKPVIRASICTGEQVAGFKDLSTGRFTEIMLIRNNEDIEEFTGKYHITREEITREY